MCRRFPFFRPIFSRDFSLLRPGSIAVTLALSRTGLLASPPSFMKAFPLSKSGKRAPVPLPSQVMRGQLFRSGQFTSSSGFASHLTFSSDFSSRNDQGSKFTRHGSCLFFFSVSDFPRRLSSLSEDLLRSRLCVLVGVPPLGPYREVLSSPARSWVIPLEGSLSGLAPALFSGRSSEPSRAILPCDLS